MKDKLGRELQIGDSVVYAERGYSNVRVGLIIKFSAKMVIFIDTRCEPGRSIKINEVIDVIKQSNTKKDKGTIDVLDN